MKAVVQRVLSATVTIDGQVVGRCGRGLLVLAAAHRDDTDREAAKMADRVAGLRVFNDADGKMNLSLADQEHHTDSNLLAVSNFTLYGETAKNRRPSFIEAAPFEDGRRLFDAFVASLKEKGLRVETGVFGADMQVQLINDGPVTVILDVPPAATKPSDSR